MASIQLWSYNGASQTKAEQTLTLITGMPTVHNALPLITALGDLVVRSAFGVSSAKRYHRAHTQCEMTIRDESPGILRVRLQTVARRCILESTCPATETYHLPINCGKLYGKVASRTATCVNLGLRCMAVLPLVIRSLTTLIR